MALPIWFPRREQRAKAKGADSGIGRTLAEVFHCVGNRLVITGRRKHKLDGALKLALGWLPMSRTCGIRPDRRVRQNGCCLSPRIKCCLERRSDLARDVLSVRHAEAAGYDAVFSLVMGIALQL